MKKFEPFRPICRTKRTKEMITFSPLTRLRMFPITGRIVLNQSIYTFWCKNLLVRRKPLSCTFTLTIFFNNSSFHPCIHPSLRSPHPSSFFHFYYQLTSHSFSSKYVTIALFFNHLWEPYKIYARNFSRSTAYFSVTIQQKSSPSRSLSSRMSAFSRS